MVTVWPEPSTEREDEAEPETGECPRCGPDQTADVNGNCSWCGRGLSLDPDPRSDPKWWSE